MEPKLKSEISCVLQGRPRGFRRAHALRVGVLAQAPQGSAPDGRDGESQLVT